MTLLPLLPVMLIESAANQLLALDESSPQRLQALQGKRVRLVLKELPKAITVQVEADAVRMMTADEAAVDCEIRTQLAVLPELRDSANITRLIKADALDIEGDPMLAQQLTQVFRQLDIDWEERLAEQLGDIPAHTIMRLWRRSRVQMQQLWQQNQRWVKGVVTDEKSLLVSQDEFQQWREQLQQLRSEIDRLERRAQQLSAGDLDA
ncbi:hypothetical protein CWI84_08565 [Idiomarina tyrosinivorans]|uniref:Ubiquinone biosynthesis accessory factor UbiJ n=1 Tax=Idiomarina tyrosinivorans TaxID=1445662 RepID=A0A432ZQ84_9GAMM|nr:SCP2 sterol-binding domain-containing protein [Idiomarina tyrosinivorans]RUO80002.1 hypothetical protein CWI84_08565 [Idiomarina tyrosinivorans]